MKPSPLQKLHSLGQSIWLDYIRRDLVESGKLAKLIEQDALRGMTSNPSIFEKAVDESDLYDEQIQDLVEDGKSPEEIYEIVTQTDVRSAADVFRDVYDETDGKDGFVSLEVNPHLAHDTDGTISEAKRLWKAVDRPNIFIKVPATREGLPAIRDLIAEGININVTLLFGLPRYREVVDAYISGLEARVEAGKALDSIASVASFFLSRIDVLVDGKLETMAEDGGTNADRAAKLRGEVAIASAKTAYMIHHELFGTDRFAKLAERGARRQRLLWASTSTKNPDYSDVKYVDALIAPNTVNTVPMDTLDAYRDHGNPAVRADQDVEHARWVLNELADIGIDIDAVTQQLEDEGVEKFNKPFDAMMETLEKAAGKN
jgi:transaldolase